MALDNTKLLLRLLWQPASAMSQILDQGSLLFASIAVLVVSLLLQFRWFSFYTPLLVLAMVYVPGTLLATNLIAHLGGLGAVFERDYSSLLTCASMAWAAVNIPLALIARVAPLPLLGAVAVLGYLYFAVLMFFAVRTVFGIENGMAAIAVGLSVIPLAGAVVFWGPLRFVLGWLASPFFLFYALYYLGGEFRNMGAGLRRRQNFSRMLQAAAVNPHDADAQYQLGLIHQQRRQYSQAADRFKAAVAIDPTETDAHFQLGRMAREQGRLDDALAHFQAVLKQDEKHNLSEIHRETGVTYLARGQYEDARRELAIYLDRRPYDPEGLYHYGQTLERSAEFSQAREMYGRAVEAARTAPRYRRRYTARWSRLAQKQGQKLLQRS
jgi:tetratricopeptide (TPR) repeat protein